MSASEHSDLKSQILAWVVGDSSFHSYLRSNFADAVADYVRRGRRHGGLANDVLIAAWTRAFKGMVAEPTYGCSCPQCGHRAELIASGIRLKVASAELRDLEAELECREVEPPYDEVKAAIQELSSKAEAFAEALAQNHAEADRVATEFTEALAEYQSRRARSQ